jgi:hypothetical protein
MSERFVRRGVSKYHFLPVVAAANLHPTRAEITAGTDLSAHVADVNGFMLENQTVDTPDMGSKFTSKIPGIDQAPDSNFVCYEYVDAETIEELLPKGTVGFVVIMRKGDQAGSASMDTFPVMVASRPAEHSGGNDPARQTVNFAITGTPALDVPVPAAGP